jgi:hypothetical protein
MQGRYKEESLMLITVHHHLLMLLISKIPAREENVADDPGLKGGRPSGRGGRSGEEAWRSMMLGKRGKTGKRFT